MSNWNLCLKLEAILDILRAVSGYVGHAGVIKTKYLLASSPQAAHRGEMNLDTIIHQHYCYAVGKKTQSKICEDGELRARARRNGVRDIANNTEIKI
ncbi:uncharacterized protein STEHIDRAFT_118549 [Stereum hirsutum FP-91666 SS1]|uniref:uncharacterized protein n=1 Tax=Stereum hirsutum (strain FP-91666) TaxID=721885 RepID=UPI000440A199|nr:uncharacterized protein STEHIDRAFT_118549 [Stereum hirsutum FP-91666 SS1]EIM91519.1 hypothetical protein STEHIDRAFT_118549 [Stereum hirsutum FP-91666 SS1]